MKRVGNLYEKMMDYDFIERAIYNMLRHKKDKYKPGTMAFQILTNIDYYTSEVYNILNNRTFKSTKPRHSYKRNGRNGKLRNINAPHMYPDQIIH